MHQRGIAALDLSGLNVFVFGEFRVDDEVLIIDRAVGGDAVLFRQREDDIGLADGPAFFAELRGRRQIFGVALLCSLIHPLDERINILLRQSAIIYKLPVFGVRVPGRHLSVDDDFANQFSPRPHLFIVEECHRRGLARLMTHNTVLKYYRRNVL